MDVHTPAQRSKNMAAIKGKDTKPEKIVRSLVFANGYRYRLHRKDLPGTPDLVFPRYKKIILVHGCFWHMHSCPVGRKTPKTNTTFWRHKRLGNVHRDGRTERRLRANGWSLIAIWECQTKNHLKLEQRLLTFLKKAPRAAGVSTGGKGG